jgi:hypothetical protein
LRLSARRVCPGRPSDCSGRPLKAGEVIRNLLRIDSNGLYTVKNFPAASHQLAHLTGTSVEFQLGLEPIHLRSQLYSRFFDGSVQCA